VSDTSLAALLAGHPRLRELMRYEYVSADVAKRALREVFDDIEREFDTGWGARAAETDEERQRREAVRLLRATIVGTLSAVLSPPPSASGRPPPPLPPQRPVRIPLIGLSFGEARPPGPPAEKRDSRPRVHTPTLHSQLLAAFEAADELLAAARPRPPERVTRPWSKDAELIDTLHDLLAAGVFGDGEMGLRYIAGLRGKLAQHHDIEVVAYDGSNDELFTVSPNRDPANSADPRGTTLRPALLVHGQLLRRGEARAPAPTEDSDDSEDSEDRGGNTENGTDS
jgi:hypothetical protein